MDLKRQDGDYRTQSLDLRSSGRGYLVLGKWLFFSEAEAEAPVFWSSDATHWKSP